MSREQRSTRASCSCSHQQEGTEVGGEGDEWVAVAGAGKGWRLEKVEGGICMRMESSSLPTAVVKAWAEEKSGGSSLTHSSCAPPSSELREEQTDAGEAEASQASSQPSSASPGGASSVGASGGKGFGLLREGDGLLRGGEGFTLEASHALAASSREERNVPCTCERAGGS